LRRRSSSRLGLLLPARMNETVPPCERQSAATPDARLRRR
jgi:hypothetical protein